LDVSIFRTASHRYPGICGINKAEADIPIGEFPTKNLNRRLFVTLLLAALTIMGSIATDSPDPGTRGPIFRPPFEGPPSLNTWYLGQPYGNTVGAFRSREHTYNEGQGIHFGVDFTAKCDTPVLAIGDGTVHSIDGPWGSAPHNLVLSHANGLFSLYGHLRQRTAHLYVGQRVKQGDVVGISGDWIDSVRCNRAPHLHLEIRTDAMRVAVNPIPLIDAPWQDASLGVRFSNPTFEIDLESPRRWQSLFDQPDIRFGGPLINDYSKPWPPD
jgi:murein DD-endopeptidase MepM/ murein hydrolase activator NlpD